MEKENNKITFEEHKQFGHLSKIFNDKLVKTAVKTSNQAKTKTEGRKITIHENESIKALTKLRDHLEEIMFKDYPDKAKTGIYYGER